MKDDGGVQIMIFYVHCNNIINKFNKYAKVLLSTQNMLNQFKDISKATGVNNTNGQKFQILPKY